MLLTDLHEGTTDPKETLRALGLRLTNGKTGLKTMLSNTGYKVTGPVKVKSASLTGNKLAVHFTHEEEDGNDSGTCYVTVDDNGKFSCDF